MDTKKFLKLIKNQVPKMNKRKRSEPNKSRKKLKVKLPAKLKKNKRFQINCSLANILKNTPNILYNGRVGGYITAKKHKIKRNELGYTSGLSQISIFNPVGKYKGFHILIKVNKDIYPLTELKVLRNFYKNGYAIAICNNVNDGEKLIDYYLNNNHKYLFKLGFKGEIKLKDLEKYTQIYNKKVELSKDRTKEYRIHSNCPNKIRELYPNVVIDGQSQGNISYYYHYVGKCVGYNTGAPDMFLWIPKGKYNGFAAEFKYGEKGTVRKNQKEFIEKLKKCGWYVCVPRNKNAFFKRLNHYMDTKFHYLLE